MFRWTMRYNDQECAQSISALLDSMHRVQIARGLCNNFLLHPAKEWLERECLEYAKKSHCIVHKSVNDSSLAKIYPSLADFLSQHNTIYDLYLGSKKMLQKRPSEGRKELLQAIVNAVERTCCHFVDQAKAPEGEKELILNDIRRVFMDCRWKKLSSPREACSISYQTLFEILNTCIEEFK